MVRHLPLSTGRPLFPLQRLRQLRGGERARRLPQAIGGRPRYVGRVLRALGRGRPWAVLSLRQSAGSACTWRADACPAAGGTPGGQAQAPTPGSRPRPRPTSLAAGPGPVLSVSLRPRCCTQVLQQGAAKWPTIRHRALCFRVSVCLGGQGPHKAAHGYRRSC